MALVKNNSGFSLVEVMVGVGLLGAAALMMMNFSKQESKSNSLVGIKEVSSRITKEVIVMLEHKAFCESVVAHKGDKEQIKFTSSEGNLLQKDAIVNTKFKIDNLSVAIIPAPGLPSGYALTTIKYSLISLDGKSRATDKVSLLTSMNGTKIKSCITPQEDGEALIENKAVQIAKTKVCTEDLRGTLQANGKCNWPVPVNYEYVEIQL